jgi:chromosome segregation ATPase
MKNADLAFRVQQLKRKLEVHESHYSLETLHMVITEIDTLEKTIEGLDVENDKLQSQLQEHENTILELNNYFMSIE